MSTTTTNYGLIKPVDADNADLKIFVGQNMDMIDAELLKRLQKDATYGTTTNPTNSGFRALGAGTQSISASVVTKITFTSEEWDTLGEYDSTNSKFTALTAGVYMFSTCFRVGNVTPPQMFITLYKNNAEYCRMQNLVNGGALTTGYQVHGCAIIKLNAGDYIEVYGWTTVAGTVQNSANATFFSGVKIG